MKFVVLRLLTRELTGKLNREHYNSCGSWKVLNIWTGNFDIIFKFNSLALSIANEAFPNACPQGRLARHRSWVLSPFAE